MRRAVHSGVEDGTYEFPGFKFQVSGFGNVSAPGSGAPWGIATFRLMRPMKTHHPLPKALHHPRAPGQRPGFGSRPIEDDFNGRI